MRTYLIPFFLLASLLVSGGCKRTGTTVSRFEPGWSVSAPAPVARKDTLPATPADPPCPSPATDTVRHIHIDYAERVEGYAVSADVFLDTGYEFDILGSVELHFTKGGSTIDLRVEDLLLWDYLSRDSTYVDGQTIIGHFSPPPAADTLSCHHPFFFYDVDFDRKKEILVSNPTGGLRGCRSFSVFETTGELREDEPFDGLDSGSYFNAREKSITQTSHFGLIDGTFIMRYVRQNDGSFLLMDGTHIVYSFETESSINYHYLRKGDKMVLVDSTIVK